MTIATELAQHAVSREEIARRYPGPTGLIKRILGVVPHSSGVFEIWPPALVTVNLSVPTLFDVPRCDLGMGLDPASRARVALASSRAFGCNYCTAHTAIMGTLIQGPADRQMTETRVRDVVNPDVNSGGVHAAIRYGRAIGTMPTASVAEEMAALREHFQADDVEAVVLAAVNMGLLNRMMDTLGIPLETAVESSASTPLRGHTGWLVGQHSQGDGAREDAGEVLEAPSRVRMLREVPSAIAYTRRALAGVPSRKAVQRDALRERLGFVPYWMDTLTRPDVRRLFVFYMLERLTVQGVDEAVDPALKATMGWVHARAAGNPILAGHFAFLALRAGVAPQQLRDAELDADSAPPAARAALTLAHATKAGATVLPESLVASLLEAHSPAGIIELVTMLAIVTTLHRYTHSVVPDEHEPEVAKMLAENGATLAIS